MAKFKHNKKRNTGFLYETAVLELTRAVLSKNEKLQKEILDLIKESFLGDSWMKHDLKLYRTITQTKEVSSLTAEKILESVKRAHRTLDEKKIHSEQNKFNSKIRKILSKDVFSNFVPNYKSLASLAQIFNEKAPIKTRVLLENEIIKGMSEKKESEKMVPIDNLIYKSFVKKFNSEYKGRLLEEQKTLLNKYMSSFSSNDIELKIYLNEEIGRLKKELKKCLSSEILISDSNMSSNANKVLETLELYKERKPDKEMIEEIIKIQSLIHEIKSDAN
jgi:hypothetical protein